LKTFVNMVAAAGAGSVLAFLARIALGVGWEVQESFLRERLFMAGMDSVLVAVVVGLVAVFAARGNSGRAFLVGLAIGSAPWSWIAFPIAVVLVVALWKFIPPMPKWVNLGGGLLAFALMPIMWLTPPNSSLLPYLERPQMEPLDPGVLEPAAGSPDVVLIVCDTLRADAVLDPAIPTPNLDALRAAGTWSRGAVAPANQTLPSHLSLLFALDIEHVGMRSNLSRWPSPRDFEEEVHARSLAQRFRAAGYRTQAVASNKLLSSSAKDNRAKQWLGEGFHTWYDVSRRDPFVDYLRWLERNSLIGLMASNQVVFKKRPLNFLLRRLLSPLSLSGYRKHFEEGETTVAEVRRSLEELTVDDRPYFLFTNFMDPHDPYLPPKPFAGTLALEENRPDGYGDGYHDEYLMRHELHQGCLDRELDPDTGLPHGDYLHDPSSYRPTGDYLHDLYREEVAYFDTLLGQTLESIHATGRPTIVLFVSDHGEGFGRHRDAEHGHTLHESEIRVPFILSGVGVPQGKELPFAPELVDGSRTLLEMAGIDTAFADGRNVLDSSFTQRETLSFRLRQMSSFDGRWKVIADFRYTDSSDPVLGDYILEAAHLFDIVADPEEQHDLLAGSPREAERLLAAIRERLKEDVFPELSEPVLSDKESEILRELGYLGEDSSARVSMESGN
jgi:arylsulfatase A-like enzyme